MDKKEQLNQPNFIDVLTLTKIIEVSEKTAQFLYNTRTSKNILIDMEKFLNFIPDKKA